MSQPRNPRWAMALLALVAACGRPTPHREAKENAPEVPSPSGAGIATASPSPSEDGSKDAVARLIDRAGIDDVRNVTPELRDEAIQILGAPVPDCGLLRPCDLEILARAADPRASRALVALLGRPRYAARRYLVQAMARHPRPEYVAAIEALLDDRELVGAPASSGMYYGAMHRMLVRSAKRSPTAMTTAQVEVLSYCAMVRDPETLALLRRLALDRARSSPDPRALVTLSCGSKRRDEDEAAAIASVRLVAMAWLDDRQLARKTANDAAESGFVRRWAAVIASAPRATNVMPPTEITPIVEEGDPSSSPPMIPHPLAEQVPPPCH